MKSNPLGAQAVWFGVTATLFGFSTVCRNDIHSDGFRFCHQSGSRVRTISIFWHDVLIKTIVNGTHLAADAGGFLEKRRRGLVRFANALVQHPVLNQEQLVIMFLTVPTVSLYAFDISLGLWGRLTTDTLVPGTFCLAQTGDHICPGRVCWQSTATEP